MTDPLATTVTTQSDGYAYLDSAVVASASPFQISYRGGKVSATYLSSYAPAVGATVAIVVQGSSFLVLGALGSLANKNSVWTVSASTTNTANPAYGVLTGTPNFQWTKYSSVSFAKFTVNASCYCQTSNSSVGWGIRITSNTSGASADYDVALQSFNSTLFHLNASNTRLVSGVAADSYTVYPIWKRAGGTGTITQDSGDQYGFSAEEV